MSLIKKKNSFFHQLYINNMYLFFIRVFFHGHWRLTGQQGKREDHLLLHSTSPIYSYLQLCMWDKDHIFLIAPLAFSRLLLDEIYHLIELLFDWLIDCWLIDWLIDDPMFACLLDDLILDFCHSNRTRETGGLKRASTITLLLQVNRLTKCASHPKILTDKIF